MVVVIAVVGWLYRQTKADISDLKSDMNRRFDDMNRRFDRTDDRVDELYKMLAQKGIDNPVQQPQTTELRQQSGSAVSQPLASASPVAEPAPQSQKSDIGFATASAQSEE